jgi:hypothetical protein
MRLTKEQEEMLMNPKPGTAVARARDYGVDLTLNLERLRRSLEERLADLQSFVNDMEVMRNAVRRRKQV